MASDWVVAPGAEPDLETPAAAVAETETELVEDCAELTPLLHWLYQTESTPCLGQSQQKTAEAGLSELLSQHVGSFNSLNGKMACGCPSDVRIAKCCDTIPKQPRVAHEIHIRSDLS